MEDLYWKAAAKRLAELISRMPDVNASDLDADPQKSLADYKLAPGSWDERTEASRQYFTRMDGRQFRTIFVLYKERRDQIS
jgi:hypothetical protein